MLSFASILYAGIGEYQNMKKVITYGTFDLLHEGHLRLLRRAANYGDELLVGVSTDYFTRVKGKKCVLTQEVRLRTLQQLPFVDFVFYENCWEQKEIDIRVLEPDVLVMGSDWTGQFDHLPLDVIYLPRTEGISTSYLKEIFND